MKSNMHKAQKIGLYMAEFCLDTGDNKYAGVGLTQAVTASKRLIDEEQHMMRTEALKRRRRNGTKALDLSEDEYEESPEAPAANQPV